jgi:hypothetical protein
MIPEAGHDNGDIEQVSINDVDPQQDVKVEGNDYGCEYRNAQNGQLIRASRASKEIDVYKNPSSPIN